jgi:methylated-DNA-[protein]-cysteine S-methyltransferase
MSIEFACLESPVGPLVVELADDGLRSLSFSDRKVAQEGPRARKVAAQLKAYFAGDLTALDGLAVAPEGTDFQKKVWAALRKIPVGATTSYAQIAREIGHPTAVRAVGAANGRNPIALVVPCHRVIGSNGTLTGYAGGLWRKQWLLQHERALLA